MMLSVMYMILLETVRHVTITYNLGGLADWISAIGTVAAVVVSLYLASHKNKPRLRFFIRDPKDDGAFGVQNKSYNPVELELKWGNQSFLLSLNPMGKEVTDLLSDDPFGYDTIILGIHTPDQKDNHSTVKLRAYDRISGSHYKIIFYFKDNQWFARQYHIFAFEKFSI